jgi:hypothetical protein
MLRLTSRQALLPDAVRHKQISSVQKFTLKYSDIATVSPRTPLLKWCCKAPSDAWPLATNSCSFLGPTPGTERRSLTLLAACDDVARLVPLLLPGLLAAVLCPLRLLALPLTPNASALFPCAPPNIVVIVVILDTSR